MEPLSARPPKHNFMPQPTPILLKLLGISIGLALAALIIGTVSAIPAVALWAMLKYVISPEFPALTLSFFKCWIVTTAIAVLLQSCRPK